jgi:hypothetical protein
VVGWPDRLIIWSHQHMNPTPRQKLRQLIQDRGVSILNDTPLFRSLLNDYCSGGDRMEQNAIIQALQEGLPQSLMSFRGATLPEIQAHQFQRTLFQIGMRQDLAVWALSAWAEALGVQLPPVIDTPPPPPPPQEDYHILANQRSPQLIIYLIDVSASMNHLLMGRKRVDVVTDALRVAIGQMVARSMRGTIVIPRYRIALFAYSDDVYDLLGGIKTISDLARIGPPKLECFRRTETARAFERAESLIRQDLPNLQHCPAPVICHMTDGEYTGDDPSPIVRRIMATRVPDGHVLVENIFISDRIIQEDISNPREWKGILPETRLLNDYAEKLRALSSPLPRSYCITMGEEGYNLSDRAVMMLPGMSQDLIKMGFVMSAATPVH